MQSAAAAALWLLKLCCVLTSICPPLPAPACLPLQVQLDGTVRASGSGSPPWEQWLGDIPELDSVRTKFTDGVGL